MDQIKSNEEFIPHPALVSYLRRIGGHKQEERGINSYQLVHFYFFTDQGMQIPLQAILR